MYVCVAGLMEASFLDLTAASPAFWKCHKEGQETLLDVVMCDIVGDKTEQNYLM